MDNRGSIMVTSFAPEFHLRVHKTHRRKRVHPEARFTYKRVTVVPTTNLRLIRRWILRVKELK